MASEPTQEQVEKLALELHDEWILCKGSVVESWQSVARHVLQREAAQAQTIAELRELVEIIHDCSKHRDCLFDNEICDAPSVAAFRTIYAKHFAPPRPEPKYKVGQFAAVSGTFARKITDRQWDSNEKMWKYALDGNCVWYETALRPLTEAEYRGGGK